MKNIIITIIIALIAGAIGANLFAPNGTQVVKKKETAYERVIKTRKIRCAYGLWEPVVMKNPNTGELHGFFIDLMEQIGKALNMEIEWTLEVDWGQIPTILQSKKVDAHCAGVWASPSRGTRVGFSDPVFYTPVVTVARLDDNRFDKDLNMISNPDITIAVGDDDVSEEIATRDFPMAKREAKSQLVGDEQLLMFVATGKADVSFNEPNFIQSYIDSNPGQIKIVQPNNPVRLFGNTIGVDIKEGALLRMFNTAIKNLTDSGSIQRMLEKYDDKYDIDYYVMPSKPYEVTN